MTMDNYGSWDDLTDEERLQIAAERHDVGGIHGCCVCGDWLISEVRRLKRRPECAYCHGVIAEGGTVDLGYGHPPSYSCDVCNARAEEREACANVAADIQRLFDETQYPEYINDVTAYRHGAEAAAGIIIRRIRARGEK